VLGWCARRRRSENEVGISQRNLCPWPVRDVHGVLHAPDPGVGGIGRGDWGGVDDGRAFLLDPVYLGLNKLGNRADTQLSRRRHTDSIARGADVGRNRHALATRQDGHGRFGERRIVEQIHLQDDGVALIGQPLGPGDFAALPDG